MHLEVSDEFGHCLFGHLRSFGEHADRCPGVVEVLEDGAVGGPHDSVATLF